MNNPASPYFTPLSLRDAFNVDSQLLTGSLRPPGNIALTGRQTFQGIPFDCGSSPGPDAVLLEKQSVTIEAGDLAATYVLFLHIVEDCKTNYLDGFADDAIDGNTLGGLVSHYTLEFSDGEKIDKPILRRFAIQQARIRWGASPVAAVPASKPEVFSTATELIRVGQLPGRDYGNGETRASSGRDGGFEDSLWLYALPNPFPKKPIRRITCTPQKERSLIFAITLTDVKEHPLRPGLRRKVRLDLPEGAQLNKLGELENVDIDLGSVISARAALDYDSERWLGREPDVQPVPSAKSVVVEYSAHPQARLYVGVEGRPPVIHELSSLKKDGITAINPAHRPVTIRVVEKGTQNCVPVRLHLHGQHGEYLPPRGNHRKVNPFWFEDNYGEFVNGHNQYAYMNGECIVDLPLGDVYVEITRGYEVQPIRTRVRVTPETSEFLFELEKVLRWRECGWVTADTHVHFLSPTTALLEGQAEGVNVVNLLASQWGEMFSNVSDFDGKSTLGARDFGGNGEFLVRVGTENRMQVLGHISLLGYSGQMIHPLCTGGPGESALGDPQETTMAEWAKRCIDQGGLVIMPHAPDPQLERAADFVLGVVHGVEMMCFNPFDRQLNPYGIADWYRYLNLGYQLPVVGGSDKMGQAWLLGGCRTYAHLGDLEFTYDNWMRAVRGGNTFVTIGPLIEFEVEGMQPGGRLELPADGGTVEVSWRVASVGLPVDQVEIILGGLVADQVNLSRQLSAERSASIRIQSSSWLALRVRGSYKGVHGEIAAHSSSVQVIVGGQRIFSQPDAVAVLEQIEGAIAYIDTIAPRPDAVRFKQMRATLESAHQRLHQRMHQAGVYHEHTPVHHHGHEHEH